MSSGDSYLQHIPVVIVTIACCPALQKVSQSDLPSVTFMRLCFTFQRLLKTLLDLPCGLYVYEVQWYDVKYVCMSPIGYPTIDLVANVDFTASHRRKYTAATEHL